MQYGINLTKWENYTKQAIDALKTIGKEIKTQNDILRSMRDKPADITVVNNGGDTKNDGG